MLKRTCFALSLPIFAASCGSEPTAVEDLSEAPAIKPATPAAQPMLVISDGRTDGSPVFYFLFPIVAERAPHDRPFDEDAAPTVTICRFVSRACAETVAEFPYSDRPGASLFTVRQRSSFEFYIATWATPWGKAGERFRATVKSRGIALGFADILLVRRLVDLRSVPKDVVGVLAGWPLPIPFRIDAGAVVPANDLLGSIVFHRGPPDGSGGTWTLYRVAPDGSQLTVLTPGSYDNRSADVSPDGRKIVFSSNRSGQFALHTMNVDGSGVSQPLYVHAGVCCGWPRWSPDGTRIVFNAGTPTEIFVMNADGSNVTQLTTSGNAKLNPAWSPDGSRIAFWAYPTPASGGEQNIFVMNANGTGQAQITDGGSDQWLSWCATGRIAFQSRRSGEWAIYTMNPDGSNVVRVTPAGTEYVGPACSPSGQRIAFTQNVAGAVYRSNVDGSSLQEVLLGSGYQQATAWGRRP